MDSGLIDWEATMRETHLATHATAQRTVRISLALTTLIEGQENILLRLRKSEEVIKRLQEKTEVLESSLSSHKKELEKWHRHHSLPVAERGGHYRIPLLWLLLCLGVVFGVSIANLF